MARRRTAIAIVLSALLLALVGYCAASAASAASGPAYGQAAWHAAGDLDYGKADGTVTGDPSPSTRASGTGGQGAGGSSTSSASGGPDDPRAAGTPSTSQSSAPAPKGKGLPLSTTTTADSSVALTFDDGPGAQTPQLLALLDKYHVQATFCLVGVAVRAHPDLVRQIVAAGHTICNHSWKHDEHLGDKSPAAIRADLQATNDEIHKVVPDVPIKYFRHPAGNFTVAAVEVCQSMGMTPLGWSVDPRDWDIQHIKPGPALTSHIENTIRSTVRPGSIVLSHDAGGDRSSTIAAYTVLIPELKNTFTIKPMPTA